MNPAAMKRSLACGLILLALVHSSATDLGQPPAEVVDATSLTNKILCGYQGWFRCPGDPAHQGWIHWSRDSQRIAPETLTFDLWPDMTEYAPAERFAAPGFTNADATPAYLYSAELPATVRRHFDWMRTYGIDGVWLQHFLVDLPGGPLQDRYASRCRVLQNVRAAARETGRTWAIAFDIAGLPTTNIYDVLTREWRKLVADGVTADPRYLHQSGSPVVEIWGLYYHNAMTAPVANQLLDFLQAAGPCHAFVVGGGDWDWRRIPDMEWQACLQRFDAYSPWNVGNVTWESPGVAHAATDSWVEDQRACAQRGQLWLPVVYPGFSWDHLQNLAPGTSLIPRRDGRFLWEQFYALSQLDVRSACVAMFDEVDEGTAIFKVSNLPPTQAYFVSDNALPTDWYLRLVGTGSGLLRNQRPVPHEIPLQP
jgi:hypothetical protein